MEAMGLFEAKTHFSEVVARAEAGEEVIITRHNKPVAKIVPVTAQDLASDATLARRREAIDWLMAHRKLARLAPGETMRSLIEDGRRY